MIRKVLSLIAVVAVATIVSGTARAAEPLVDVDWVKANTGKAGVVFVDLRPHTDYLRGHVPGAVHTNYGKDGWRVESADKVPDVLPADLNSLATLIGGLGIANDSHVVLLPPGANSSDMGIGTRIYWTFKVLGHDKVSILNGGMAAYAKDKENPMETGAVTPAAKTFAIAPRMDMVVDRAAMRAAVGGSAPIVDLRTEDQFAGVNRHPKAKSSGTIPGSRNLPQSWLTENGGGTFRSADTLKKLFEVAEVPTSGEQIMYCNTGHWASIGWFAASELLGNKNVKLYDGSMVDWTLDAEAPMEQKVKL